MRFQSEKIRLGSFEWVVRPLTLRQVQEIEPILIDGTFGSSGNIGAAIAIVGAALKRDYPDSVEGLLEIEATAPEVGVAMAAVLRLGGFIPTGSEGDAAPGEDVADAAVSVGAPASIIR